VTAVKPGLAAALCSACQHPTRRHSPSLGCTVGECWCDGTDVPAAVVAPPSAAELALLDARCRCGHGRTEHGQRTAGSGVPCFSCACRQFHVAVEGVTYAPVAPKAEPAPPAPAAAAPAPAAPPAAEAEPVGEQPAPRPVTDGLPRWDPPKLPRSTPARPAAPALGSAAVVGELDAVEEVAVASTSAAVTASCADVRWDPLPAGVQATPEPLDLAPFLGASLHSYAAWYCARCYQRRHDPGACPGCRRPLVPVHVVIVPRSI
jgi:hypothetical protein